MRRLMLLATLSAVVTLAFTSVAIAQSAYSTSGVTGDCSGAAEEVNAGAPWEYSFIFLPDAGGCIAEGTEISPYGMLVNDLNKVVFDPDTGERLGTARELDPDLSGGANSVTHQEFCGAFPEPEWPAQGYFEQAANAKEQTILDPDGDDLACSADDIAFLTGDTSEAPSLGWEDSWAVGQGLLTGRTPMPGCHGQSQIFPDGGRLSIQRDGPVLAWYCVEGNEVDTVVTLTNISSVPLVVESDPSPADVSYGELSPGDSGQVRTAGGRGVTLIPIGEKVTLDYRTSDLPADITLSTNLRVVISDSAGFALDVIADISKSSKLKKANDAYSVAQCAGNPFKDIKECGAALAGFAGNKGIASLIAIGHLSSTVTGWTINKTKGDSHLTVTYTPAQSETLPEQTSEGQPDLCAGIADCEQVDRADVDGDDRLDDVALVDEPDEYPSGPNTQITVRVLLADGTALTRETALQGWYGDTAWHGATDFGQVPGEELVIGGTSGPHTKWYRVLTYRDGELVELPYPDSDPARSDLFYATMWPIDAALSAYVGVQCETADSTVVLRSVTTPGAPSEYSTYEGEATSWVLDGDQWRMTDSRDLQYPDGSSASEIAGWQCGDLPRGYDLGEDASSANDSGDSDTGAAVNSSGDSEEVSLDQAVGDYYLAAGAAEWAYTYTHLDSQTQSMFTEEEWSQKNQWFWDLNPTVYHILSIESDGNSEGSVAEVELRITPENGSSWTRTTYFVKEDGEWLHRFSEEETALFMPDVPFEEFVEAHTDASVRRNSSLGYLSPYEYEQTTLKEGQIMPAERRAGV